MTRFRAIVIFVCAAVALAAVPARARESSADDGSGIARVVGFFSLRTGVPADVAAAIDGWEAQRLDEALAALARADETPGIARHRDEIYLLRGLVLDDLDWRDEAAEAYAGVLAIRPPSPYYPLALLRLVEGRRALGQRRELIEAYRRHFEPAWTGKVPHAIRNVLEAYGDLRRSGAELTAAEREAFASPTELAELARDAKERPAERTTYLAGLELVAAGELRDGIAAFERIGLSSPYFRYGLFSAAQASFASDDFEGARRRLRRLAMLPARHEAEIALAERAHLLEAQILFAAGDGDAALRAAADAGAGPFAFAAQLLRGEICLESGSPSLAVAYLRDVENVPSRDEDLDTRYALGLGAAYRSLGDVEAASTVLRGASARLGASRSTLEGDGAEGEIERLRREAESFVAFALERGGVTRARLADGIRRVVTFKGPMNLGKLVRVIFTSHENTIVGEPVYDTKQLAEAEPAPVYRPKRPDALWRAYLASPERPAVESALRRGLALARDRGKWLARETMFSSVDERSSWRRRRIVGEDRDGEEDAAPNLASRARSLVEDQVTEGLRRVVRAEAESIRRLQYEVDLALSQALANEGEALRPTR